MHCPVCKTPLWTDSLFTPARLHCPRCGAVFKSTVPWGYFRIVVLVVVVLCLFIIGWVQGKNLWLFPVFVIGLLCLFWFLPRLIDLQHIPGRLKLSDGISGEEQLKLRLEDQNQEESGERFRERLNLSKFFYFLVAVGVILLLFMILG